MLLTFTPEQEELRRTVEEFGVNQVLPLVQEMDRDERFPRHLVKAMADLGWLGGVIPADYGGSDMDFKTVAVIVEELGRYSQPVAAVAGHLSTAVGFGILMATALPLYFVQVEALVGRRALVAEIHTWTGVALLE